MGKSPHERCNKCGKKKGRKNLKCIMEDRENGSPAYILYCKKCCKKRPRLTKEEAVHLAECRRDRHIAQLALWLFYGHNESNYASEDVALALHRYGTGKSVKGEASSDLNYCNKMIAKYTARLESSTDKPPLHLPPGLVY